MRPQRVVSVIQGPPDAIVGIDTGGDDGYRRVSCAGLMYAPQVGDTVLVDSIGDNLLVMRCVTPGRLWVPPSLALQISNSAPTDPDAVAVSSVAVKDGTIFVTRATPVTPPTITRVVARPIASRTWDPSNNWRSDDTMPRQGSFGSGINKGLWFYPPGAFDALAGATGWTARMQIRRADRGGDPSGPGVIPLQVWHHPHVTQPAGEPIVLGQTAPAEATPGRGDMADFALAPSTVAAFVAGTAKGAAIASDVAAQYLIAFGPANDPDSGVITFTRSS